MANTSITELFKDRRVQIGAALAAVAVLATGIFAITNSNSGGDAATDATTAPPPAPNPGAPGVVPGAPGANPVAAGAPGSPLPPGAPATGVPGKKSAVALAAIPDSWASAPAAFPGGGGTGAAAAPNAPGAPGGVAPAAGGAPGKLPKPIRYGSAALGYRGDPFLSTIKFVVDLPPAYQFVAPIRLASQPKPEVPSVIELKPEERLGPLPLVPRRVAGILYDGSVSAILETGTPGDNADVRVVEPGALVPSGVPGLPDFTVSVITTTQVTLRAVDGRTVSVPLSTLPRAIADSLRQQAGQQAGQGGQGGVPGAPGDFGPGGPGGQGGPPGGIPGGGGFRPGRGGFRGGGGAIGPGAVGPGA